jgi:threonylcarbamoyladenosine tRNA methylthiotransferase MtaB
VGDRHLLTRERGEAGEGDHEVVEGALAEHLPARDPGSALQAVRDDNLNDVQVVTFGCRLNAYESDAIRVRAAADAVADAVVFNTCAVTGEAVRQARQAIRKARRERPGAKLVVTGCAAQIDPSSFAAMPEVDLVLGNADKAAPGALLRAGFQVGDIFAAQPPSPLRGGVGGGGTSALPAARTRKSPSRINSDRADTPIPNPSPQGGREQAGAERARAYVEIQNGCDHRCTFCIIPFGRGNSRSIPARRVVDEVSVLAASGFAEVVLTGVDLTSWGGDLDGRPRLGDLVRQILSEVSELPRLRLSSIDAAEIDGALLECLATQPRLAPHLHLSLQSGDDLILKRMKRRHCSADALALIAAVRAARPGVAFGADFIAGFPTESDAAAENTVAFVERAGLSYLHVFPYSPRPGTPAARMPLVARDVVKARAARLRAAGDAALIRHLDRQVGRRVEALVERSGRARAADFTEIGFEGVAPIGRLASFDIMGHDGRMAIARPL